MPVLQTTLLLVRGSRKVSETSPSRRSEQGAINCWNCESRVAFQGLLNSLVPVRNEGRSALQAGARSGAIPFLSPRNSIKVDADGRSVVEAVG